MKQFEQIVIPEGNSRLANYLDRLQRSVGFTEEAQRRLVEKVENNLREYLMSEQST